MGISFFTTYALMQRDEGRFRTAQEAFCFMHKLGIDSGDIVVCDLDEFPVYLYCDLLKSCGINPSCMISTINVAELDPVKRARNIAISKERIDAVAKAGIDKFMIAPLGFEARSAEEWKRLHEVMTEGFAELAGYAKKAGVQAVIENHSSVLRPDSKSEHVRELLDNIPDIGYIFDTGNFFCINEDVLKAYEILKDRIVHVHCKDWKWDEYGDQREPNMPRFRGCGLGDGDVPLSEVLQALKNDGYDGELVIEINSDFTWDEFDRSVEFLKKNF